MTHPCRPLSRSLVLPRIIGSVLLLGGVLGWGLGIGSAEAQEPIKHSYLVMGAKTAILGEDGNTTWEYSGGSRDGFVLPNGNVLLAFSDRVEEVTPDKQIVFRYRLSPENKEIGTAERLYNGNTNAYGKAIAKRKLLGPSSLGLCDQGIHARGARRRDIENRFGIFGWASG